MILVERKTFVNNDTCETQNATHLPVKLQIEVLISWNFATFFFGLTKQLKYTIYIKYVIH